MASSRKQFQERTSGMATWNREDVGTPVRGLTPLKSTTATEDGWRVIYMHLAQKM